MTFLPFGTFRQPWHGKTLYLQYTVYSWPNY